MGKSLIIECNMDVHIIISFLLMGEISYILTSVIKSMNTLLAIVAILAIVTALGLVTTLTSITLVQQAQAFSDVQSCQHFYHFFAGGVGNSGCGKGQ